MSITFSPDCDRLADNAAIILNYNVLLIYYCQELKK
jgi:hypothetical protein